MMKKFLAFLALSALTLVLGVLAFGPVAFAGPVAAAGVDQTAPGDVQGDVFLVEGDCYAIGEQIAQENGGTVAKAVPVTQGGQPMCKVVVLIPGAEGERPKRLEFTVPQ